MKSQSLRFSSLEQSLQFGLPSNGGPGTRTAALILARQYEQIKNNSLEPQSWSSATNVRKIEMQASLLTVDTSARNRPANALGSAEIGHSGLPDACAKPRSRPRRDPEVGFGMRQFRIRNLPLGLAAAA